MRHARAPRAAVAVVVMLLLLARAPVGAGDATPAVGGTAGVPMFRGDPARTGVVPGPGPLGAPAARWRFRAHGPVGSSPAVVDGTAYVGSEAGFLYAVDAATGAERWRYATDFAPSFLSTWDVAVADGLVFVPATGFLVALG